MQRSEEERRRLTHDAVVDLIIRGGIAAASLRNVAAESGLNIGSVRHLYPTAEALLAATLGDFAEQANARLTALAAGFTPGPNQPELLERALGLLAELLPLDERRTREAGVWLAVHEHARTTPKLRPAVDQLAAPRQLLVATIAKSRPRAELTTEALAALCDGLAIAMLLDRVAEPVALDALRLHLSGLFEEPAPRSGPHGKGIGPRASTRAR